MRDAAVAGIPPLVFYEMTLGEIFVAIDAYNERERQTLLSRLNAVLRGLSTLGKKHTDPYKGLEVNDGAKTGELSGDFVRTAKRVFKGDGPKPKSPFQRAKELWLWSQD